jgi:hypothetical protein
VVAVSLVPWNKKNIVNTITLVMLVKLLQKVWILIVHGYMRFGLTMLAHGIIP